MPLLSIITVTLNNLNALKHTIKSISAQTYKNFEHIVIDGGSSDGTIQYLQTQREATINWISEPDEGIYDAMNKGIKHAKGDWIIYMNAGDTFYNENTIYNVFFQNSYIDINILYGNTIYKNSNETVYSPKVLNRYYFYSNTLCHQSIFTRKDTFIKTGLFNTNYNYIADREWLLRSIKAKIRFQYLDKVISKWDTEGSCSTNIIKFRKEIHIMRSQNFNIFEMLLLYFHQSFYKVLRQI